MKIRCRLGQCRPPDRYGRHGCDTIDGGTGSDTIQTGTGHDTILLAFGDEGDTDTLVDLSTRWDTLIIEGTILADVLDTKVDIASPDGDGAATPISSTVSVSESIFDFIDITLSPDYADIMYM